MGKKVMTEVEKSIHEESEKISEARKAREVWWLCTFFIQAVAVY